MTTAGPLDRSRRRRPMVAAAHAKNGSNASTSMHGCDDRTGRLKVACADAVSLARHNTTTRSESDARDKAINDDGSRQRGGSPSSESTRSADIPAAPSGVPASNASSAEASAALSPAAASTAAL